MNSPLIPSLNAAPARRARSWPLLACALALCAAPAAAEQIGSVDTTFKLLGPDHKIVIDAFDDPGVEGVACHISRARTGGIKGGLGLAKDTSDASIACRQVGPIRFRRELKDGEEVFNERRSLVFKELHVVRFFDRKRNTLVYLTYSDRLIEGSPKNSLSSVPIMPWPGRR